MPKVQIDKDQELSPGDRVELHFRTSGMAWIKATQIILLEQKMKGRKDWVITGWETPEEQTTLLIMRVEVLGGPHPDDEPELQTASITGGIIAATILAATIGLVSWLTFDKIYLINEQIIKAVEDVVDSPAGKAAVAGTGIGIAAAGIAALLLFFLPKK